MNKRRKNLLQAYSLFCIWAVVIIMLSGMVGCSSHHPPTPDDPIMVDDDRWNVSEVPDERDPYYAWDFIHRSFIYPAERFSHVPRYLGSNRSQNTNTLDEAPDSSWYTNRHARKRMTLEELTTGPNTGAHPDFDATWTIVRSKTQGITPGFTIKDQKGDSYVIKFDPVDHPEMATAAEAISTLFLYAAGYNTPENYVVFFDPDKLVIGEGAKVTDHRGKKRPMNQEDLKEIMSRVSHRPDGTIRALASKYLSGKLIGPFSYRGKKASDPNDIYSHRYRRELRGLKVIASFINHVDIKGPNSLNVYITENKGEENERSYVKHYLIDFGASLGSGSIHPHSASTGHEYVFDLKEFFKSLFTLGLLSKPWDDAKTMDNPAVGFFEAETFNPGKWKQSYTNPAFMEISDQDSYWGAKIVMAFTPDEIRAIVKQGQYTDPEVEKYIADTLIKRREKIGRYWYNKMNPLDRFEIKADDGNVKLNFTDLGVESGLWQPAKYHYELRHYGSKKILGSSVLDGNTDISIPTDVLSSMGGLANGKSPDDKDRFFYYKLETEREGNLSKEVRVYIYSAGEDAAELKIVQIERED